MRQVLAVLLALSAPAVLALPATANAQQLDTATQNAIRVKFINATRAYEAKKYTQALSRLDEIDTISGGAKIATAQGLKVKVLVALKRWEAARDELNALYALNASASVIEDVALSAEKIDVHFAKLAEKERAAEAKRKRDAKLAAERADKKSIMRNPTSTRFDRFFVFKGTDGRDGRDGRSRGRNGGDGTPGTDGTNGRPVNLVIREVKSYSLAAPVGSIERFSPTGMPMSFPGSLVNPAAASNVSLVHHDFRRAITIDTSGGRGGNGGDGGKGEDGRSASLRYNRQAGDGGNGGDGARGGNAGNAADVTVTIYGSDEFYKYVRGKLRVRAKGGAGGQGGERGSRGRGGRRYGASLNYPSGRSGQKGYEGSDGRRGRDGKVTIKRGQ